MKTQKEIRVALEKLEFDALAILAENLMVVIPYSWRTVIIDMIMSHSPEEVEEAIRDQFGWPPSD